MLALKQALSLVSSKALGSSWQPSDETNLEAWYKNQTGITLNGSDVSAWADSSSNSFDMLQATASNQPAFNGGDIDFTAADTNFLQSASDITLSGAFTVGFRLEPTASNNAVLGSNNQPNEFFKITSTTNVRFKTDNNQVDLGIDSGTLLADLSLVITRNASNLITMHINGVAQADTETLAGTADINAIGIRNPNNNPYDGTISELQIYDTESTALTANVNTYLSNL
tara:strand:+ start:1795 stop:2475 length:681 start_codon:yes stop_codon:yes gene_type:complete